MKGETPMRSPHVVIASTLATLLVTLATSAFAQTPPASYPIAPGADLPAVGLGGIGAGNVPIAPGAAMSGDTDIERIGPGGGLIAPGPAGSVGGLTPLTTPVAPSTPSLGGGRMR
jgi:hypothetical protein